MLKSNFIRTKIMATVGPGNADEKILGDMIDAGVDVFRFNMSHGDHSWHEKWFRSIRKLARKRGKAIAILADLQGPKFRVGQIPEGTKHMRAGEKYTFVGPKIEPEIGQIPVTYEGSDPGCQDRRNPVVG